jgi:ribosomal protein L11 methyltransferase
MSKYASHLNPGGKLLVSGFFETDCDDLIAIAQRSGLKKAAQETKNEWAMLTFEK